MTEVIRFVRSHNLSKMRLLEHRRVHEDVPIYQEEIDGQYWITTSGWRNHCRHKASFGGVGWTWWNCQERTWEAISLSEQGESCLDISMHASVKTRLPFQGQSDRHRELCLKFTEKQRFIEIVGDYRLELTNWPNLQENPKEFRPGKSAIEWIPSLKCLIGLPFCVCLHNFLKALTVAW